MERADVLIVGGGPAGSSCATALVAAGRDVLVLDQRRFPRDKPCAGWITPQVVERLGLRLDDYGKAHTLQPISRFRVGRIGRGAADVDYGAPVSYAIRRGELDAFLLRRSGARAHLGERVADVRRAGREWVVDGRFVAPVLVGAGGYFCPVARLLNGSPPLEATVVAQEIEVRLEGDARAACRVEPERPEIYFCPDLRGYGWCVRKGAYLNLGLGRRDPRSLPRHVAGYLDWLVREGRVAAIPGSGWCGHAYLLREGPGRRAAGNGILLVGDAAGLAFATSGEGILPAVVSGQLAAEAILEETDDARRERRYCERLDDLLGPSFPAPSWRRPLAAALGSMLFGSPAFCRRLVLDQLFLHRVGAFVG